MVGMLGVALAMFLFSTAMVGVERQARRKHHRPPTPAPSGSAAVTLGGEALFATGLDPDTVLLDCVLGLQRRDGVPPGPLHPVALRVHKNDFETPELLSGMVRAWAEGGDRVFVELPFSVARSRATLTCGARTLTVAVENGNDVWRSVGRTAAATRGRR
jgi:hypothetical protein